jgi:hypothetical protein
MRRLPPPTRHLYSHGSVRNTNRDKHFAPDFTHHDLSIPLENHLHSNMGGGALTGYASDLETRMRIHKGEVGDADTKEALKNLDLANKKLDMPGIISFP